MKVDLAELILSDAGKALDAVSEWQSGLSCLLCAVKVKLDHVRSKFEPAQL